jgi:glycogen debranching enzyme
VVSSNAGHTLLTGIASPERARRVARTLTAPACSSGWGIRTVSRDAARYNPMSYHNGSIWPHDNALIALGFARYGLKSEVLQVFQALFDAATYMELRRLPELYCGFPRRLRIAPTHYPVACSPQAWACASLIALIQASLGLSLQAVQDQVHLDQPALPDFLNHLCLRRLVVNGGRVDLVLHRHEGHVAVTVTRRDAGARVEVSH